MVESSEVSTTKLGDKVTDEKTTDTNSGWTAGRDTDTYGRTSLIQKQDHTGRSRVPDPVPIHSYSVFLLWYTSVCELFGKGTFLVLLHIPHV